MSSNEKSDDELSAWQFIGRLRVRAPKVIEETMRKLENPHGSSN